MVVLSGFQWTIWRIYTTLRVVYREPCGCFIRISMNNLKDIHNLALHQAYKNMVVLSGFQWTILLQKYRKNRKSTNLQEIILIFQKKALPLQQQIWRIYTIRIIPLCKHSEWHACVSLFFVHFPRPRTHLGQAHTILLLRILSILSYWKSSLK